jgi:hypothetical protein
LSDKEPHSSICLHPGRTTAHHIELNGSQSHGLEKAKGDPMSRLANKVALVTGGSRGIGAAIGEVAAMVAFGAPVLHLRTSQGRI